MNVKQNLFLAMVLLLAAGVTTLGCGSKPNLPGGVSVEQNPDGELTVTSPNGDVSVKTDSKGNVNWPDDFPEDIWQPSNTKVTAVAKVVTTFTIGLKGNKSQLDQLLTEGKAFMEKNGWTLQAETQTAEAIAWVYVKAKRQATFAFDLDNDNDLEITLMVAAGG